MAAQEKEEWGCAARRTRARRTTHDMAPPAVVEVVAAVRTPVGSARRSESPVASRDDLYMYTHTYTHAIACEKMDFDSEIRHHGVGVTGDEV